MAYICPADILIDDMKRTLGAQKICLPGSVGHETVRKMPPTASAKTRIGVDGEDIPISDLAKLSLAENAKPGSRRGSVQHSAEGSTSKRSPTGLPGQGAAAMFRSVLNGDGVSPRMETQRLFGGEIAR
jgi:hypothetical protein